MLARPSGAIAKRAGKQPRAAPPRKAPIASSELWSLPPMPLDDDGAFWAADKDQRTKMSEEMSETSVHCLKGGPKGPAGKEGAGGGELCGGWGCLLCVSIDSYVCIVYSPREPLPFQDSKSRHHLPH